MNGAPSARPVIAQFVGAGIVLAAVVSFALPLLYRAMLDLSPEQAHFVTVTHLLGVSVTLVMAFIGMLVGLRGVAGAPPEAERARLRVLRLPVRLAALVLISGGTCAIAAATLRVMTAHDPTSLVAGIALTSTAMIAALAVPTFVGARAALLRHALHFASARLPMGRRTSIGLTVGYTIFSVAAIALVPAAVFGNARLVRARAQAAQQRSRATANRLALVIAELGPTEGPRAVVEMHLPRAAIFLRAAHERGGEITPEGYPGDGAEAPIDGGGAVIVVADPTHASGLPLLLIVLALEGLVGLIALSLARSLIRDTNAIKEQVNALADERDPPASPTLTTSEVRRLSLALNRLLERIPRLQLEKYLAVEQADESRRLKSMFLANMSHDLRSPLNSILGFSELITRGLEGPITDAQRALLDDIHETGSHLLRLLSQILETARAESGHLELDRKLTPPATLVTLARKEALRGRPERVGDRLEIELQAGVAPAHVDALRMQQALTYALDWAIEVARGGMVHVDVADRNRPNGRALIIEIWCDGMSSLEDESQLFQPFRKVEGVPGLHLALPLTRRLVEAHGGQIEAYGGQRPGVRIILARSASERRRT